MTRSLLRPPPNYKPALQTAPKNQAVLSYRWLATRRDLLPGAGSGLVRIPRGSQLFRGVGGWRPAVLPAAPAAPRGGRLRLLRSFPVPGRELPAERGADRAGAALQPAPGPGFVRSSRGPSFGPTSARHAHRDPCCRGAETRRPPGTRLEPLRGQRRAWWPGSRRDSRQLTQVSGPGDRGGPGGPEGVCAARSGRSAPGRTGLTPRGGEGDSGAGASLPGSGGTGAGHPELLDTRTGRR